MTRPDPEQVAGLYGTFEAAADAVAELAVQGLAAGVTVSHPAGHESGPTIEVEAAGQLEPDPAPPGGPIVTKGESDLRPI